MDRQTKQGIGVLRFLAGLAIGLAIAIPATLALAHHGALHVATYKQTSGAAFFPATVVLRCEGWAEDTSNLRLVAFQGDRVVYRCILP